MHKGNNAVKTGISNFLIGLFPPIGWLPRYNKTWFIGDVIAGVTVGLLVVPQALVYAKLAGVPLEFGLYTSIVGVLIYWIFATSKDVTIGPTAVLSQLCGQLVAAHIDSTNKELAVAFLVSASLIAGLMEVIIGLLNFGIIVDFIPTPVITGFTSGAAISIMTSQLASLLGINGINAGEPAYLVTYRTVINFSKVQTDAIVGIAALIILIIFRFATSYFVRNGFNWFIWVGQLSNAIVTIAFTIFSYFINIGKEVPAFRIVGYVPQRLNYMKIPSLGDFNNVWSAAMAIALVSIIEHIAVAKSFGRLNGYSPDPNQEIIALGMTNILGSFLGGFPATGSFSRSSIMSRSKVKTPFAGIFSGCIVFLAIYVITPAFYYIPNSVLAAMIINAISDLLIRPNTIKELWEIEISDFISFILSFLITIFVSIEVAIYFSVGFSVLVLLYRVARPRLVTLVRDNDGGWSGYDEIRQNFDETDFNPLPAGIAIFRIEENLTYPNSNFFNNYVRSWINVHCSYNGKAKDAKDQLWCTSSRISNLSFGSFDLEGQNAKLPVLRAVIFDFSSVNRIDATGLQTLIDLKREIEDYSGCQILFFFAHVNQQLRRVLQNFLLNASPYLEVTPVLANAIVLNFEDEQNIFDIQDKSKDYGSKENFAQQFVFRTIDQAVAAAKIRFGSKE
jgi:sodium-independent sulfate anion transporter 11